MQKEKNKTASIFGIRFSTANMGDALDFIDLAIQANSKKNFCAFVNADCLNIAYHNREYAETLNSADQVWPDGIGVALAARHVGTPVSENVNGTDMFPLLCQRAYRIFLLGGRPGVAEQACLCAIKQFPKACIVGTQHGYFASEEAEVIAKINATTPDILLVGFGVPKQEFWIRDNFKQLNCPVTIGVGGLFDFVSGRIKRAPFWLRSLKLEWLYRLYQEPIRLFRRYVIGNPLFLGRVLLCGKKNRHPDLPIA